MTAKFAISSSFLLTLILIVIVIPLTVVALKHQTSIDSQAAPETPTPLPEFVPTPARFPPTIVPFDFPTMHTFLSYDLPLTARDKDPQDILQITASGLPQGLSLSKCTYSSAPDSPHSSTTCFITGSPTQTGTFTVTFTVFDKMGNLGQLTRSLTVKPWYTKLPFLH